MGRAPFAECALNIRLVITPFLESVQVRPSALACTLAGDRTPTVAFTKLIHVVRFVKFELQTGFLNSPGTAAARWHLVRSNC